jgi:hypothetical protein
MSEETLADNAVNFRAFLQSPYTPFIVLFCHMIETSDSSDLHHLGNLVATLAASDVSHHHARHNQLSVFKALYDVAVKYFDIKSNAAQDSFHDYDIVGCRAYSREPNAVTGALSATVAGGITGGSAVMDLPALQADQAMENFGVDMNHPGDELATWYYTNYQMMRMLDDL